MYADKIEQSHPQINGTALSLSPILLNLHRGTPSKIIIAIQNYNRTTTFNAESYISRGDVAFASPYMAIVKPLISNHLKTCNPKSFEPNDYKRSNIINTTYYYARINLKGKSLMQFGSTLGSQDKQGSLCRRAA